MSDSRACDPVLREIVSQDGDAIRGFDIKTEISLLCLEAPLAVRLGERGHQRHRRDELHRVAGEGMASRPSAMARCVLPTPGGPSSSRFSPLAIHARRFRPHGLAAALFETPWITERLHGL